MLDFRRKSPTIAVINQSTVVSDAQVKIIVDEIRTQVSRDIAPAWGLFASLILTKRPPAGSMQLIVADTSDEPDAEGYHFLPDGMPVAKVFAKTDMANGQGIDGLSVTMSHEIIEMLIDPSVNLSADGPDPVDGQLASFAFEGCDAVQGNSYRIGRTAVSDFVYPEWFEAERPSLTRFSYLQTIHAPFSIDSGGYASVRPLGTADWVDRFGRARFAPPAARHRLQARSRTHPSR